LARNVTMLSIARIAPTFSVSSPLQLRNTGIHNHRRKKQV